MLKTINLHDLRKELFNMQDTAYRDFHSRLVPNIEKNSIIGIRTPILREFSKKLFSSYDMTLFLQKLPHLYYEENNIHALFIQSIKDFDSCILKLELFLPYIDNWATCDVLRPYCFKKNTDRLYPYVKKWLCSDQPYTVRFAIGMLNSYYLDSAFSIEHLKLVSVLKSEEYYVKMMAAWYFATALSKQYDSTISYIENKVLDKWTHNKAIQKAIESYRISESVKTYLKSLKIK